MCYSFNLVLEYEQENVSSSNSDGPDYGLSLVIDIEKSQYMRRGLSSKEGVIISLASKSQSPNLLASPLQICKYSAKIQQFLCVSLRPGRRLPSPAHAPTRPFGLTLPKPTSDTDTDRRFSRF